MSERRKFQRVCYREALGIETNRYEEFKGAAGQDLSSGGMRIRSEHFMPIHSSVRLRFRIDDDRLIVLEGKVVWVQKERFGDYYQLGVEFQENSEKAFEQKRVQKYIGKDL